MATDNDDVITTAALYLGGGALGWMAGGLAARYFDKHTAHRPADAPRTVEPATTALVRPSPAPAPADQPVTSPKPPASPVGTGTAQTGAPSDPYPDDGSKGPRLSRRFDAIFETYRGEIPIEYLRALAMRESGMQPSASSGPARGLLQITEVARIEYNRVNHTSYTREQLLDPTVNIAIACWLLRAIVESYQRHHGDVPNLRMDWNNRHFVGLLTQGWNAGYSEVAGVGWVARYLKARNLTVTIDAVHQHAAAAFATRHLRDPVRLKWWRSVVDLYERERRRGASWWAIKTPGVILEEMHLAKQEIYALGRDIYATFMHPFERQLAKATQRFEATYGRTPGVGRLAEDSDMPTVHSWMQPVPTADDLKHVSYEGRFVFEWGEFERAFGNFFAAHSGSWTERFFTGVYDQTIEYRERAADWRRRFEAIGGKPTTPTPRPPADSFLSGFTIPWRTILLVGGGITAGLLIVPAAIRAARSD